MLGARIASRQNLWILFPMQTCALCGHCFTVYEARSRCNLGERGEVWAHGRCRQTLEAAELQKWFWANLGKRPCAPPPVWPFCASATPEHASETKSSTSAPWRGAPEEAKADANDWEDWTSVATTEDRPLIQFQKLFNVQAFS